MQVVLSEEQHHHKAMCVIAAASQVCIAFFECLARCREWSRKYILCSEIGDQSLVVAYCVSYEMRPRQLSSRRVLWKLFFCSQSTFCFAFRSFYPALSNQWRSYLWHEENEASCGHPQNSTESWSGGLVHPTGWFRRCHATRRVSSTFSYTFCHNFCCTLCSRAICFLVCLACYRHACANKFCLWIV